jgi:hypothetical protein
MLSSALIGFAPIAGETLNESVSAVPHPANTADPTPKSLPRDDSAIRSIGSGSLQQDALAKQHQLTIEISGANFQSQLTANIHVEGDWIVIEIPLGNLADFLATYSVTLDGSFYAFGPLNVTTGGDQPISRPDRIQTDAIDTALQQLGAEVNAQTGSLRDLNSDSPPASKTPVVQDNAPEDRTRDQLQARSSMNDDSDSRLEPNPSLAPASLPQSDQARELESATEEGIESDTGAFQDQLSSTEPQESSTGAGITGASDARSQSLSEGVTAERILGIKIRGVPTESSTPESDTVDLAVIRFQEPMTVRVQVPFVLDVRQDEGRQPISEGGAAAEMSPEADAVESVLATLPADQGVLGVIDWPTSGVVAMVATAVGYFFGRQRGAALEHQSGSSSPELFTAAFSEVELSRLSRRLGTTRRAQFGRSLQSLRVANHN